MGNLLYAATEDGVQTFRKAEGESSWALASEGVHGWSVQELVVMPSRPNVVFAGTRGDGVWTSENFGETWRKTGYGRRGPGKVRCLTLDPHNSDRLYAGCEPIDIYVSNDCGKSWDLMSSLWDDSWVPTVDFGGSPTAEPHVRDIAIDPNDQNTMYIALQVGFILKTTDGGFTWKLLNKEIDSDVHTFAIDPNDSQHVVVATGGHDARLGKSKGKALYATHDGGESWKQLAMNFPRDYSLPLVPKPGMPQVLYASLANSVPGAWRRRDSGAEGMMIRSSDGGESWEQLDLNEIPNADHSMITAIAANEESPDYLLAGFNDGEIIETSDGGESWKGIGIRTSRLNDLKFVNG